MSRTGPRSATGGPDRTIVYVDDSEPMTEVVKERLERSRPAWDVRVETTPAAALEYVTARPVDCVVSDYEMPETTGIELFEQIRAAGVDVPFVLYTMMDSTRLAARARDVGVTAFLVKDPADGRFSRLIEAIDRVAGD